MRGGSAHNRSFHGGSDDLKDTLTLTVGPGGDLAGDTETTLQAGLDYLAAAGGGTLRLLPGTFVFSNALYLRSHVDILGSGSDTVIVKGEYFESPLSADADWYDSEMVLENPEGFDYGAGITLFAKTPHNNGQNVIKRTIIGRDGNRFLLNKPLEQNFWADHEAVAKTLFPLLSAEEVEDVRISNLRLDGNRDNTPNFNGNYGGGFFAQNCKDFSFHQVESVNYNGDGFSWQICHDFTFEDCLSQNNADLGFHPGSGSRRPIIRNNRSLGNGLGLFFCWGVKNGVAEDNLIEDSRDYGISIGHRDNDNLVRNNTLRRSGKVGLLFREESGGRDPLRNRFENNVIEDSGEFGIDLQGDPAGTYLIRNSVTQKEKEGQGTGLRIGPKVSDLTLEENRFVGFEKQIEDLREQG
jgi:hypothetical protein